ncbi:hypothetical protein DFS34DRAFT_140083 [Phlyctochytrium arcticum]|nr:hypothetical protein DFS34DRAFT_140083 [Phlyctochytrium arcticum]
MGREISCKADWEYYSMYGMLVVFYLMVSPFILWRLQCVRDNNGVRNELLGVVAVTIPLNLVYFGWRYMPHKYYVAFHPQYWRILGLVIAHTISTVAPTIRSYRDVNMRQKTKLLHNMASFEQVLSDKSMWDAFKSHMAADFCVENALFYEAYQELMVVSAAAFARSNVFVRGMPQESALASSALRGTSSRVAPHTRRASGGNPNNATSCQSGINNPAAVTSMCAMTSTRRVNNPIGSRHSSGSGATATTSQNYTPELQSSCEVNSMKGDVVFPEFKDMSVPDAAKSLYTAFFEVYLTTGGSYEVNVPFHIRDEAQALVVADTMKVGMFARAKEEIVQNMFLNSFPSFLHRLRSDIPNSDALFGSISSPSSNLTARNSRTTRKPIPQATPAAAAVATTDWRSSVDEQEAGDYASEMEDVMGGGAV